MMNLVRRKFSLRKNDQVQVIAGREKGKTGKILKIDSKTGRVTVEKVNLVKRHTRPTPQSAGGITEKELPLHYSNVLLHCSKCNRGVRHGQKVAKQAAEKAPQSGTSLAKRHDKFRVCKRCGESLDQA